MSQLTHYIIVRRDLPLGVVCAMVTHAAGESGALYGDPYDGRFRHATAVVLEVKNESELKSLMMVLRRADLQHVVVSESDPPYNGSLMAIGLVPTERDKVGTTLESYQTLKKLYVDEEADVCTCSGCQSRFHVEGDQ